MKRKGLCILFIMLLLLASCKKEVKTTSGSKSATSSETAGNTSFALPYYSGELLNPYSVQSKINSDVLTLVYNGLISVTSDFTAKPEIAQSFAFEGKVIVFKLNPDIKFSDGSTVKASDIVYSYNKAKAVTARFGLKFNKIRAFYARDNSTFCAEVSAPSERFYNLFDIPVIKENSDAAGKEPIGCGKYYIKKSSAGVVLYPNNGYTGSSAFTIKSIPLVDMPDEDTLLHSLNSGMVTAAFADMSGKSAGLRGLELRDLSQNNLVFAGINTRKAYFSKPETRKAVSTAINRSKMSRDIMLNSASLTWQPFNPSWQTIKDAALPDDIYNLDTSKKALASAGITEKLKVLVNLDNRLRVEIAKQIVSDLSAVGIKAELSEQKWGNFTTMLRNSDFDIYIGEIIIPNDMDISVLYKYDVNYTGSNGGAVIAAMNAYDAGGEIGPVVEAFDAEAAILPLFYKKASLAVSKRVKGDINPLPVNIFNGIESWTVG